MNSLARLAAARCILTVCALGLLAVAGTGLRAEAPRAMPPAAGVSAAGPATGPRAHLVRIPLAFEPNLGQAPPATRYVSRGPGLRIDLETDAARLTPSGAAGAAAVRVRWVGGSTAPATAAQGELPGKVHYHAADPARGRRNVPTYRQVVYRSVYPGTDLVFHGAHGAAEFDFVVAPGADPRRIMLELDADSMTLADSGDIVVAAGDHTLRLHAPVLYQESAAGRTRVDGRFRVDGRRIAFDVGEYDRTRPLVIDPVVSYATYLDQGGRGVGVDAAGNMYAAGRTGIVKLSADGSRLLYSVVLGDHEPRRLVVDGAGNAYVLSQCPYPRSGITFDCPTRGALATGRPQAQGDAGLYVSKLSPTGGLLFATSVGGFGTVQPGDIAVDAAGNIYVTGFNAYGQFPATGPAFAKPGMTDPGMPAFVASIAADLSRFRYLVEFHAGGEGFQPTGIAVDRTGAAYLIGVSGSEFPTTPDALQPSPTSGGGIVVAKVAPDASRLVYGTYFGGRGMTASGIAVDASGNAYITGTAGAGLPAANAIQPELAGSTDAFVARLDATGSALAFATYLGGSGSDDATGVRLDSSANVYVAGVTRSTNFPLRSPLSPTFGAAASNFVTALTSDGSAFIYSTYFANDQTFILDLAAAGNGTVYLTGETFSSALPTVRPYQASPGPAFLARIDPAQPRVFITSPAAGATVSGTVTSDVWMENTAAGSRTIRLSIGGVTLATTTSTANHVTMFWDSRRVGNGTQTLVATLTDASGATGAGSRTFTVQNADGGTPTLVPSFTSPGTGATVGGIVTIGMAATGASGTPITFSLSIDGTQVFTAAGTATTASFAWNTATVANGGHTLGLTVRDGAGRTATTARSVTVSNPAGGGTLKVFITSPAAGSTVSGTVWSDVWVEGAAAGSRVFALSVGGTQLASVSSAGNHLTLPWDSRRVANGTQTLTATVRDSAGKSGSSTRAFNVQNAGGGGTFSVFITQPASGATVRGTAWFTVWINSTAAGSKTYTLSEGGRTLATASGSNGPVSIPWVTTAADNGARRPAVTVRDGSGATGTASIGVTVAN